MDSGRLIVLIIALMIVVPGVIRRQVGKKSPELNGRLVTIDKLKVKYIGGKVRIEYENKVVGDTLFLRDLCVTDTREQEFLGAGSLRVAIREMDLYYSRHYVGFPVIFGEMFYRGYTRVVDKQLVSDNHLVIDNVELGEKRGGLLDLPLKFALCILKDDQLLE